MFPTLAQLRLPWIGSVVVQTYGVAAVVGLACGWLLARRRMLWAGIEPVHAWWSLVWLAPAFMVGAKILPLWGELGELLGLVDGPVTAAVLLLALARPGGSLLSGGIFGFLGAALYARYYGISLPRWLDASAPGLALAIPIMRIGCLGAGCCYGTPTDLPWGVTYSSAAVAARTGVPLGVALHPSPLYEAAAVLVLVAVLLRYRGGRAGEVALLFLAGYATIRVVLGFWRAGIPLAVPGALTLDQALALPIAVAAAAALAWLRRTVAGSAGPTRR